MIKGTMQRISRKRLMSDQQPPLCNSWNSFQEYLLGDWQIDMGMVKSVSIVIAFIGPNVQFVLGKNGYT